MRVSWTDLGIKAAHGDELVQAVGAVALDRRHHAAVEHRQRVHEPGRFGLARDGERRVDQPPPVCRTRGAEAAASLESGTGATHTDGAGQVQLAHLLGVPLVVAAHHCEVLVDPDVDAPAVVLALVLAPHDHERLHVLAAHRIEQLVEGVAAALPVGPDDGDRAGIVVGQLEWSGQQLGDGGRVGAVLDGQHLSAVVPRRGRHQRCPTRSTAGEHESGGHGNRA
jgi:hypothetical protein